LRRRALNWDVQRDIVESELFVEKKQTVMEALEM
jgi:hypothetical protein